MYQDLEQYHIKVFDARSNTFGHPFIQKVIQN